MGWRCSSAIQCLPSMYRACLHSEVWAGVTWGSFYFFPGVNVNFINEMFILHKPGRSGFMSWACFLLAGYTWKLWLPQKQVVTGGGQKATLKELLVASLFRDLHLQSESDVETWSFWGGNEITHRPLAKCRRSVNFISYKKRFPRLFQSLSFCSWPEPWFALA